MTDMKPFEAIIDHFGPQVDLHPDLAAFLEEGGRFGPCLRHPLVYSIMHMPQLNGIMNKQYENKLKALAEAVAEGEWHTVLFLHERPYRVGAFVANEHQFTDREYWKLLGQIWIDSENIRQNVRTWQKLLASDRGDRAEIMNAEERADLAAMPAWITVYQGHTDKADDGWSWTTNRDTAVWFAKRFGDFEDAKPMLTSGTVRRKDVLAYFARRNESEILVPRRFVKSKERTVVR